MRMFFEILGISMIYSTYILQFVYNFYTSIYFHIAHRHINFVYLIPILYIVLQSTIYYDSKIKLCKFNID